MNSQRYRIVLNRNRGQLMAVAKTATAQGKSGGTTRPPRMRLPLLLMASGLGLGAVLPASAQIVAHRDAPGNQRATVLVGNNGVPVVNVQTPSRAGVSRNTYSQFDVQGNGSTLRAPCVSISTRS